MIQWKPFIFQSVEYDLTHLHPFEIEFKQAAIQDKPEKSYFFQVCFSLHCFTYKNLGNADNKLLYSDNRETRVFCFERYELSKKTGNRHRFGFGCFQTNEGGIRL